jgi:hypothetical protein
VALARVVKPSAIDVPDDYKTNGPSLLQETPDG